MARVPIAPCSARFNPPDGSCDCPDYTKSSLGLCKHLLAILAFIHARPGRLRLALAEQQERKASKARLFFHPVRPLDGPADWMAQIRLSGNASWASRLRETFTIETMDALAPAPARLTDPVARRALVADLLVTLESRAYRALDPEPDPALKALLLEEDRHYARRERLSCASLDGVSSLRGSLYPYQLESVRRFLTTGRLLLADDMGLGKTAQAIAAAHILYQSGCVRRGLIVVPAALKAQWLREWSRFTDVPAQIVDGRREDRLEIYRAHTPGFLILNYELLIRDLAALEASQPDMMILDEAQRMKNWATKTARSVKRFDPAYRLILSGTPMQNRLEELISLMEWIDEKALEPRWRLVPWHTEIAGDGGSGFGAARNLDTLRARLTGSMLRRSRSEVLDQLPARTDTNVPIEMTERQQEQHDALTRPIVSLLSVHQRRPLTHEEFLKLMRLLNRQRMISNGLGQVEFDEVWPTIERRRPTRAVLESLASPKLIELRELIQSLVIEQRRKVVVFSEWRRMLRLAAFAVSDLLEPAGIKTVFFTGAETRRLRDRSIVDFNDDPATRVMMLTEAGGVGLNLQRAANACINLELPWNPAVLEQRIGRIYRLGQADPVDVYNLVTQTGIESRIERIVRGKRALFDAVFDGTSDEVRFDANHTFLEGLELELRSPAEDDDEDDELHEIAESSEPRDAVPDPTPASPFERVRIERTPEGGLRIEAAPDAAAELASMFEGMARLFRSAVGS